MLPIGEQCAFDISQRNRLCTDRATIGQHQAARHPVGFPGYVQGDFLDNEIEGPRSMGLCHPR